MAETLGPFQTLTGIRVVPKVPLHVMALLPFPPAVTTAPVVETEIVVGYARASVAVFNGGGTTILNLCGGGTLELVQTNLHRLELVNRTALTGPLESCEQLKIEIRGQTSGASLMVDARAKGSTWPACGLADCYLESDPVEAENLEAENFPASSGIYTYQGLSYTDFGFTLNEFVDLVIPSAPRRPIASIAAHSPSGITVTTSEPHGFVEFQSVRIRETALHNGNRQIESVLSPTQVHIATTFEGAETNVGYIQTDYDG